MDNNLSQVPPEVSPPWGRTGRYVGALFLLFIGVAAFMFIREIAATLILALLLVAVMGRVIPRVVRWTHMRYSLARVVCYLGLLILVALFFFRVVPAIFGMNGQLGQDMAAGLDSLLATLPPGFDPRQALLLLASAPQPEGLVQLIGSVARSLVGTMLSGLLSSLQVVVFGMFLSFLILVDLGEQHQQGLAHLPEAYRPDADRLAAQAGTVWVGWLKATVIFDLAVAGASLVMFLLLGVPYPVLMTLVSAVVVLIPAFGALLASLIIAVPCYLLGSTTLTGMSNEAFTLLVVLLYNVVVGGIYYALLLPLLGKKTQLPMSVVLIGVLASFSLGSIWVAMVLIPLVATVRIIFEYVLAKIRQPDPFSPEALALAVGDEPTQAPAAPDVKATA
jgi:putative permease